MWKCNVPYVTSTVLPHFPYYTFSHIYVFKISIMAGLWQDYMAGLSIIDNGFTDIFCQLWCSPRRWLIIPSSSFDASPVCSVGFNLWSLQATVTYWYCSHAELCSRIFIDVVEHCRQQSTMIAFCTKTPWENLMWESIGSWLQSL